jgi:hypothetical protein
MAKHLPANNVCVDAHVKQHLHPVRDSEEHVQHIHRPKVLWNNAQS